MKSDERILTSGDTPMESAECILTCPWCLGSGRITDAWVSDPDEEVMRKCDTCDGTGELAGEGARIVVHKHIHYWRTSLPKLRAKVARKRRANKDTRADEEEVSLREGWIERWEDELRRNP
jgi:hypothetical protein